MVKNIGYSQKIVRVLKIDSEVLGSNLGKTTQVRVNCYRTENERIPYSKSNIFTLNSNCILL